VSRPLRSGAPRMLGNHIGRSGRWYDEHFRALKSKFGPFDPMLRSYAGSVSALYVGWRESTEAVARGQWLRQKGKGRRPSVAQIERLKRRQGLAWISYDAALRRFQEMISRNGDSKGFDLLAELVKHDEASR
jgi:hypothetical protein